MGAWLKAVGLSLGDPSSGLAPTDVAAAMAAGADAVMTLGKARVGDKTMVDSLVPFVETLSTELAKGSQLKKAWQRASDKATQAAAETSKLSPKIGRARPLAERSIGTPDAGATSLALMFHAVTHHLTD